MSADSRHGTREAGKLRLLSVSMKTLSLGTAYAVWTGIGAVGTFVVGVVVLGEPLTIGHVVAAALIASGLRIMKLSTST